MPQFDTIGFIVWLVQLLLQERIVPFYCLTAPSEWQCAIVPDTIVSNDLVCRGASVLIVIAVSTVAFTAANWWFIRHTFLQHAPTVPLPGEPGEQEDHVHFIRHRPFASFILYTTSLFILFYVYDWLKESGVLYMRKTLY